MIDIKEKIKLADFCTMRTGGEARFFTAIKNSEELKEAVSFAKDNGIKFFVLGGGSNVIFSDNGFEGLVIKNEIEGKSLEEMSDGFSLLKCGAGEVWDSVVSFSLEKNLFGLENLSNIPGTVGASAVQNIGAYGSEAKDFIYSVEVFDTQTFETFDILNSDCLFGYRNSVFKKRKDLIIISVTYKLSKIFIPNLKYSGLKEKFSNKTVDNFSVYDIRNAIIDIRKEKLPDVGKLGSVGSFFKNPIISKEEYKKILNKYPILPSFYIDENTVKIPLGFVLDKICLLKGYKKGDIGLYDKQALVIVNYGNATSSGIVEFAKEIKHIVKEKIDIEIEEEVEIIY